MSWWWSITIGTKNDNTIQGTGGDDILLGLKGDDTIFGGDGDDLLIGGAGDDTLYGGTGDDTLLGGAGNDFLYGEEGHDYLDGGSGQDGLDGGIGNDLLYGGSGHDVLRGGSGSDIIGAGAGNDHVIHNVSDNFGACDYANAGSGYDILTLEVTYSQLTEINATTMVADFAAKAGTNRVFDFSDYNLSFDLNLFVRNFEELSFDIINTPPEAFDDVAVVMEDDPNNMLTGDINVLINDTDVDILGGDFLTVSAVNGSHADVGREIMGLYGMLTLNADGSYSYVVDNMNASVDALNINDHLTDSFEYTIVDTAGHTDVAVLTITIQGANDAAIVGNVDLGTMDEDTTLSFTAAHLLANSSDVDDVLSITNVSVDPAFGVIIDLGSGLYRFEPTANFNGNDIEILYDVVAGSETIPVKALIDITPVNDAAMVGDVDLGVMDEDTILSFTVPDLLANSSDIDDVLSITNVRVDAALGVITNLGSGLYSFTPTADLNGENIEILYDVIAGPETIPAKALVDILAINDAPIAEMQMQTVHEDDAVLYGQLVANDVDNDSSTLVFSMIDAMGNPALPPAGFTLNSDGSYEFDPSDAAYQSLAAGEMLDISILYRVTDDKGAFDDSVLTINVTGTNDIPTITGVTTLELTEDIDAANFGSLTKFGTLNISDADTNENKFVESIIESDSGGRFEIFENGDFVYAIDNQLEIVQSLGEGDVFEESFVVTSYDGTATETITVRINGQNDVAEITGNDMGSVKEDENVVAGNILVSGKLDVVDVDAGQSNFVAATLVGSYGTLNIDEDGNWTYMADNSQAEIQALDEGELLLSDALDMHSETFTVQSFDGTTKDITIDITGTSEIIFGTQTDDIIDGSLLSESIFADAGNDIVYALDGDDVIHGGDGNDILFGGDGSDQFTGGAGDDVIVGYHTSQESLDNDSLSDTAFYSGNMSEYFIFAISEDAYTVIDKVSGRDGTDVLYGVELLSFADQQDLDISSIISSVNDSTTIAETVIVSQGLNTAQNINSTNNLDSILWEDASTPYFAHDSNALQGISLLAQANSSAATLLLLFG